ncbi:MAG: phytoene desaturase family protein [Verrucomicrobiota bacterium]
MKIILCLPAPLREAMRMKAYVVGGGIGGLATALRLAHSGRQVTLFEKNEQLGGKAGRFEKDGYRWDTGPSLFTLPDILGDLFTACGEKMKDHLTIKELDPICRYFWRDGTVIDEGGDFFKRPEVADFLDYASGIYQLSGDAYLNYPPNQFWKAFKPGNWPKLRHLPKICTFAKLAEEVDRCFLDPHLRQLFKRFATYNGSSPYLTPSTFNIIPYIQEEFGGWYPVGGVYEIILSLQNLCQKAGVEIKTNTQVTAITRDTLSTESGSHAASYFHEDYPVVINMDATTAYEKMIQIPGADSLARHYAKPERSLSGYVMMLGIDREFPQLSHHNIYFSDDYENEFDDIFKRVQCPTDPTIYVNITSKTDRRDAPPGCENWFVLINVPAEVDQIDWSVEGPRLEDKVIDLLEARGCENLRSHIRVRESISPADFQNRHLSNHGSLYGWASHSIRTSVLRPPLQSPLHNNLWFVGGTTHPGGGIPLVLLSAKMVTEQIRPLEEMVNE